MSDTHPDSYVPGQCNIGPAEIRRRYRNGYLGLAAALVLMIILQLTKAYHLKWLFFFPVFYALSGFIQARSGFCYMYGLRRVSSMAGMRNYAKVAGEDAYSKDRIKAWRIILLAFVGSLGLTFLYYLVPF